MSNPEEHPIHCTCAECMALWMGTSPPGAAELRIAALQQELEAEGQRAIAALKTSMKYAADMYSMTVAHDTLVLRYEELRDAMSDLVEDM